MALIIGIIIVIYLVLIAWTWNNLGGIAKTKKILVIAIGVLIAYIITLVLFYLSKNGIKYEEIIIEKKIRNVLVAVFTGVNSIVILPYVAKLMNKINEGEIEQKVLLKKMFIIVGIFLICMFLECGYMNDVQQGILKISQGKVF